MSNYIETKEGIYPYHAFCKIEIDEDDEVLAYFGNGSCLIINKQEYDNYMDWLSHQPFGNSDHLPGVGKMISKEDIDIAVRKANCYYCVHNGTDVRCTPCCNCNSLSMFGAKDFFVEEINKARGQK